MAATLPPECSRPYAGVVEMGAKPAVYGNFTHSMGMGPKATYFRKFLTKYLTKKVLFDILVKQSNGT